MIRDYSPQPFEGNNPLPVYVSNVTTHELIGYAPGGYRIVFARLTAGTSVSAGTPLAHVLFESFTDHGEPAKATRTRVSGFDKEFIAARNAMIEAGVTFHKITSCTNNSLLQAFGNWLMAHNPDITEVSVLSQTCH